MVDSLLGRLKTSDSRESLGATADILVQLALGVRGGVGVGKVAKSNPRISSNLADSDAICLPPKRRKPTVIAGFPRRGSQARFAADIAGRGAACPIVRSIQDQRKEDEERVEQFKGAIAVLMYSRAKGLCESRACGRQAGKYCA